MGRTAYSGISMGKGVKMPTGTAKNIRAKPSIGSDNKRKTKTGKTIPKKPKTPHAPRFHKVEIRIPHEEHEWALPYFDDDKYLPKFVLEAFREKAKRAEAHDKEAKLRALISNINLLEPVLKEMYLQGKLGFLNGK